MKSLLWNFCSWQLSLKTFQKASWYLWKGQNAADVLQLCCPGKQEEGKVWHRDVGAPGMLWSWIMWYFYAYAVCVQVCGRCLMAQGISMSMKSSTDPPVSKQKKVVQYICCSFDCRATMQAISPSALMIKWVIWLWSTWKFCIFGLIPRRGIMSSSISCGLLVAHISGPQLAGLGVFVNFSTHLLSWDWKSSFPLLLLVGSSIKIW